MNKEVIYMPNRRLEQTVENLFMIIPLLKRKLPKTEPFTGRPALNPSHHHILFMLDDLGEQSISDVVKALGITKTNITPLIDRLVQEGFIDRQPQPADRRFINIRLTPEGTKYLEQVKTMLSADLKEKLAPLGDEDLDTLLVSLKKMKDILEKL